MRQFPTLLATVLSLASSTEVLAQVPAGDSTKVRRIAIGGEGGWDYLTADADAKRLYVSRGNRIVVVDTDSEKVVGELTDTPGVHGVAVVTDLGRGFTSNGGDDTVTAFDLKTLKATGKLKIGGRPDAIMFDPASHRVFTYNHGSKDATAIDPSAMSVAGTVALEGVPEAAVADGRGHIFVNLMDKNEVVEFDASTCRVLNRWSLAPGTRPTGLAMDREQRRLFSVCSGSQSMVVARCRQRQDTRQLADRPWLRWLRLRLRARTGLQLQRRRRHIDGRRRGDAGALRRARDDPDATGCPDHDARPEDTPNLPFGSDLRSVTPRTRRRPRRIRPPKARDEDEMLCRAHSWSWLLATDEASPESRLAPGASVSSSARRRYVPGSFVVLVVGK